MEFAEEEDNNIFNLTPLSWEEVAKELKESKPQSVISSDSSILSQRWQHFSTISSVISSDSFVIRNNAGATPKKTSEIIDNNNDLRDRFDHKSQIECKEHASLNLSEEYPGHFGVKTPYPVLLSDDEKNQYSSITELTGRETNDFLLLEKEITQYSSITEISGNGTPITPISQLDLKLNSESSFKTIDKTCSPDGEVFVDFNLLCDERTQTLEMDNFSKNLANHSCPYFQGKLNFAPPEFRRTNYLEKELFETSTEEIKEQIDDIVKFLEN